MRLLFLSGFLHLEASILVIFPSRTGTFSAVNSSIFEGLDNYYFLILK